MSVYVFPGQGSQHVGMGRELFDSVDEFSVWESKIDEILGYSLRELCSNDPEGMLTQTQYTQPCLYVVNALHYLALRRRDDQEPEALIGHSLGEYNALWAAGAFEFLDGLRLVQKRGELMARGRRGGMAAVIGLPESRIRGLLAEHALQNVVIANHNSQTQFVISGHLEEVQRAIALLEKAATCVPLKVSAAFHSFHMQDAQDVFTAFLSRFKFRALRTMVISNVTGRPYPMAGDAARPLLARQITNPVRWVDGILYLGDLGARDFVEAGPGKVLTGLIRQIRRHAERARPVQVEQALGRPAE